ncbi:MAG: DUF424 family protein [Nanoarchaeota archaeon]
MYVKIHNSGAYGGHREVVAVCDEDLLGKVLKGDNIELKVTESFYKGEKKSEQEVILILKKASNSNLVGKMSIAAGIKAHVIAEENVIMIGGIPHAQAFTLL